jgi:hypothetical protein
LRMRVEKGRADICIYDAKLEHGRGGYSAQTFG